MSRGDREQPPAGLLRPYVRSVGCVCRSLTGRGRHRFVDPDAQARRVAEHKGAVLDVQVHRDADRRLQALQFADEVVGHRRRGVQQRDRRVADRADRQVVGVRQRGDTQEVGDSPDRGRLDDVDASRRDQRAELLEAGEVLPTGDRRPYATADSGQAVGVPAPDRLLDPGQVECAFQFTDVAYRLLAAPGLVRIQHEPWLGTVRSLGQCLAHEQQPEPVTLNVQAALELRRPQPAFGIDLVGGDGLVVGEADVQAGGVGVDHAVVAAEQPPQRLTHGLCLDAIGVTDRSTPTLRRRQASVPGDAHASALRRAVSDLALQEQVGHQHG